MAFRFEYCEKRIITRARATRKTNKRKCFTQEPSNLIDQDQGGRPLPPEILVSTNHIIVREMSVKNDLIV